MAFFRELLGFPKDPVDKYIVPLLKRAYSYDGRTVPQDQIKGLASGIYYFGLDPLQNYDSQDYIVRQGRVAVVPLLVAHAGHITSDNREAIISTLRKMDVSIFDHLRDFINGTKTSGNIGSSWPMYSRTMEATLGDYVSAAYTAKEALMERTVEGKENVTAAIDFFRLEGDQTAISYINRKLESK